nr:hypothetical protein Iba_chr09fCG8590 [Ipomoea batatas]
MLKNGSSHPKEPQTMSQVGDTLDAQEISPDTPRGSGHKLCLWASKEIPNNPRRLEKYCFQDGNNSVEEDYYDDDDELRHYYDPPASDDAANSLHKEEEAADAISAQLR